MISSCVTWDDTSGIGAAFSKKILHVNSSDSSTRENVVDRYFLDTYGFKYFHFIMLNFCTWFRVDGSDCEEEEDALQ